MSLSGPLRVLIVDDHPAIRKDAEQLIAPLKEFIVVGSCGSVNEASLLIPATKPDLILLDVNLGDGTGFDILDQVIDKTFKVIFLTAYEEYALKAIKFSATDYLLKPINQAEFLAALKKVATVENGNTKADDSNTNQQQQNTRIVLSSQHHLQVVDLKDIIYCQSESGYTTFHLAGNKKIVTSKYLKEYEDQLPATQFVRTHQSYIVNINYIDKYHKEGAFLLLQNGTKIPVAARRKEVVKNNLFGNR